MIVGHGIDLVDFKRIERLLGKDTSEWLDGAFTADELHHADGPPNHISYYAGRYAAKEAVAKALGTGFSDDVAWQDIEILRGRLGEPKARLSGGAILVANTLGIRRWLISISHSGNIAVASAIALNDGLIE